MALHRPPGSPQGGQFAPDRRGAKPPKSRPTSFISEQHQRICQTCQAKFPSPNHPGATQCPQCLLSQVAQLHRSRLEGSQPTPLDLPNTPERYRRGPAVQATFAEVDPQFPASGKEVHESGGSVEDSLFPSGSESQAHGLAFEQQMSNIFFGGYEIKRDNSLWDIPAEANIVPGVIADKYLHLPVSIKSRGASNSIGFGDAIRQRSISEPFVVMLVDYDQTDEVTKTPTSIQVEKVSPEVWESMWGPITLEHIRELDGIVKDKLLDHTEARKQAKAWLDHHADLLSQSAFALNPKIDSKGQRRVQCSMKIARFRRTFPPRLYHNGQQLPVAPVYSPPRNAT